MKLLCKYAVLLGLILFLGVNLYAQKKQSSAGNKLPTEKTNMRQILIDRFIVPLNAKEEFLKRLHINRDFIKNLPGFVEDAAYEETDAKGEIKYITVAVWENAEALDKAKNTVLAEYQKQGFDVVEMYKRLNIKIERAIYKKMDK